jgi:glycosyltransferase involved in cell wall biosynthesis
VRILFTSPRFFPSVGGVQTVVRLFGDGLTELGHEVRVVTSEPNEKPDTFPFEVLRKPSHWELLRQFRWADVVVMHGAAVSLGWPVLACRTPTVAIHYMPAAPVGRRKRVNEFLRRAINRRCRHLSVSAGFIPDVPHPYSPAVMPIDTAFFRTLPEVPRDRDMVFIGRLIEIKGVHDLLDAMHLLNARGSRYTLTIIGTGPEYDPLARRIREEGLTGQVELVGHQDGEELVRLMNRHRLVVVPSRYHEPFGLVAVEGIACGCVAVGTSGGGLPGAIGPCGVTVPNGDPPALCNTIDNLLGNPSLLTRYRVHAESHVARHTPSQAAEHLLSLIAPPRRRKAR